MTDQIVWHYNKSGEYSVRSGYWLATHEPHYSSRRPNPPHGSVHMKQSIWKLFTVPKIKHFIWRILSKALPTINQLNTRGMKLDPQCPRCGQAEETINHVLFTCPLCNNDMEAFKCMYLLILYNHHRWIACEINIGTVLELQKVQGLSLDQKLKPLWLLWHIWKSRNSYIFRGKRDSPTEVVIRAQADVNEWITNTERAHNDPHTGIHHMTEQFWKRPPLGFIKCNFDAGFDSNTNIATGGWVIRDNDGRARSWGATRTHTAISPLEAEAQALLVAMHQTWIRGFHSIIFEGDCA